MVVQLAQPTFAKHLRDHTNATFGMPDPESKEGDPWPPHCGLRYEYDDDYNCAHFALDILPFERYRSMCPNYLIWNPASLSRSVATVHLQCIDPPLLMGIWTFAHDLVRGECTRCVGTYCEYANSGWSRPDGTPIGGMPVREMSW